MGKKGIMRELEKVGAMLLSACLLVSAQPQIAYAMQTDTLAESVQELPQETIVDIPDVQQAAEEFTYKPFAEADYELKYTVAEEGITITGATTSGSTQQLVLPDEIGGVKVVAIGDTAFRFGKFTGDLTLPKHLTRIEDLAFTACPNLTGPLEIPEGVKSIGLSAFYKCTSLAGELTLPEGLETMGNSAFGSCAGLTGELKLPESLTDIGWHTFEECTGFTGDLILPDGLTELGSQVFYNCTGFDGEIRLPAHLKTIYEYAFSGCSNLTGGLVIPDGVTEIGDSAFEDVYGLTSVTVPKSVAKIGYSAFGMGSQNSAIFYVTSGSVAASYALAYELNLVKVPGANEKTYLPYEGADYELLYMVSEEGITITGATVNSSQQLVLPEKIEGVPVVAIGDYAFSQNKGFTGALSIPHTVVRIGDSAFTGCQGLNGKLTLPATMEEIGARAFQNCSGLTGDLVIPTGLTEISKYAFYGCSQLTGRLVIPKGVIWIEDYAFDYCSGLTGELVIPDGVGYIGPYAFFCCSGFTGDLVIPEGVGTIGEAAFMGTKFDSLQLPESLRSIGGEAFSNCTTLKGQLHIPDNVHYIGRHAFGGCTGFTGNLILPANLTDMGYYAFSGCTGFTGNLTIPDKLTKIQVSTFYNCSGLSGRVKLPESVKTIEEYAFKFGGGQTVTIYGKAGTYAEEYALEEGYIFVDGDFPSEAEENAKKEEEGRNPLPDDFEQEVVIPKGKYSVFVVDEKGMPLEGATVRVWNGFELPDTREDEPVSYTTDAAGVAVVDITEGSPEDRGVHMVMASAEDRISGSICVEMVAGESVTLKLKADTGKQVVTQVDICLENETVSLLWTGVSIYRNDPTEYDIEVRTNHISADELDSICLMQGDSVLAQSQWNMDNRGKLTAALGKLLSDTEETVYLVGFKDGERVFATWLKLYLHEEEWTQELAVGSAFTPDAEDEAVPARWGKGKLEFNTIVELPLEVEYDGNKVKVFVGPTKDLLKGEKNLDMDKVLKTLETKLSNAGLNSPDIPVYPCVTVGFEMEIQAGGYLEGVFPPGENIASLEGGIMVKITGNVSGTLQPKVWLVKLPAQIQLKAEASNQTTAKIQLSFADGQLVDAGPIEVDNELEVTLTLGALVGIEDWWAYGVEGGFGVKWVHSFTNKEEPNVLTLKGIGKVYRVFLGWTKVYWNWDKGEEGIKIYPEARIHGGGGRPFSVDRASSGAGYELLPRAYEIGVDGAAVSGGAVASGIYPYAEPMLVSYEGTQYLFYLNDITTREAADRTALVYRTNAGDGWSEEVIVCDDQTADFTYDVEVGADGVHVLWQNATESLASMEQPEDAAESMQLRAAFVTENGVEDAGAIMVTEGMYPFSPQLFVSDGSAYAGWYENSANDILEAGSGINTFYVQKLGTEEVITLAQTDYYLGSAEFGIFEEKMSVVFSADTNRDFDTMEDREIVIANAEGIRNITSNEVLDSCPKFVELDGKQCIIYYSDGSLMTNDGHSQQVAVTGNGMLSDSFRVFSTGDAATVVWRNAYSVNGDQQNLSMAEYKNGTWSEKGNILNTEEAITAFALFGDGESTDVVYTLRNMGGEQDITNLYMEQADAKGQVIMTAFNFVPESFVPGENFPLTLTLADVGEVPMEECSVRILDHASNVLWEKQLDEFPAAGNSATVVIGDFLPEATSEIREYCLSVVCDGTENVSNPFKLGGVDFAVSYDITYDENDQILNAFIKNDSAITGDVTFRILTDEENPVELVQKTYAGVDGGSGISYICKLDSLLEQADGKNLKLVVATETEESTYINNERTVFNYLAEKPTVTVTLQQNGNAVSELAMKTGRTKQLTAVLDGENADAVTLTWESSNPACATVDGSGNISALTPGVVKISVTTSEGATDICVVTVTENTEPEPVENPFGDVKDSDWYYPYVMFAYQYNLMGGKGEMPDGSLKFDPSNTITRAEFVTMLYSKENKPAVEYTDTFTDVPDEKWFTDAILWAAQEEIVGGKKTDYFDVNGKITRQEIALILYKYALYKGYGVSDAADTDLSGFADAATVSNWATTGMKWAVEYEVIGGKTVNGQTMLAPGGNAIRAEAATMMRAFMVAYEGVEPLN